jgi:hypothetical protein
VLTHSTAGQSTGHTPADLVLERLPSGSYAWLRPELDRAIRDAERIDRALGRRLGTDRFALTDLGRRALAMERLFGPWPTLAEVARP